MRPNRRDELVEKAMAIFYRNGFQATGMDLLAAEAGMSKTAIYKHFATKDDLVLAALGWDAVAAKATRRSGMPGTAISMPMPSSRLSSR